MLRGITDTALSPDKIDLATPDVLPLKMVQVCSGPLGPVIEPLTPVTASGIIAITGRPAVPVQPQ